MEHEPDTICLIWLVPFARMNALRTASCSTIGHARGVQNRPQKNLLIRSNLEFEAWRQNGKPLHSAGVIVRFAVAQGGDDWRSRAVGRTLEQHCRPSSRMHGSSSRRFG